MNPQKFTLKAQETLQQAQNNVLAESQQSIEAIHLLYALILKDKEFMTLVAGKLSANLDRVLQVAEAEVKNFGKVEGGNPYYASEASRVLAIADKKMNAIFQQLVNQVWIFIF